MQCPIDQTALVMTERQGIEIDYCPKCRGVWLDRGELDKILERAGASAPTPTPRAEHRPEQRPEHPAGNYQKPYRKKRESIWGELFDF